MQKENRLKPATVVYSFYAAVRFAISGQVLHACSERRESEATNYQPLFDRVSSHP